MPKIVFLMLPEPGHLVPTFRVARLLRQRGHAVHYLTIPDFRDVVVRHGFGFAPLLPRLLPDYFGVGGLFETASAGQEIYRALAGSLVRARLSADREIAAELDALAPDLAIVDSAMHFPWTLEGPSALERLACSTIRMSVTFTEEYDASPGADFFRRLPELILCPGKLDLPRRVPGAHTRYFVESSIWRERPEIDFPWDQLDAGRMLAYCSFGTQSPAYEHAGAALRCVIESFRGLDAFQLVVAIGGHQDAESFDAPPNVLLRKSVPQLELLGRASLFITHGGLGGIKESILAGVPMLALPFAHDQPLNAQRIAYHGLGTWLPPASCSTAEVREAILRIVADGAARARVCAFGTAFAQIENQAPSVHHIERLIESAKPLMASRAARGTVLAIVPFYLPYPGGAEKSMHEMLRRLVELGYEAEALVPIAPFPAAPLQKAGTQFLDGVRIRRLPMDDWFAEVEAGGRRADLVFYTLGHIFRLLFDGRVDALMRACRKKTAYFCRGSEPVDYFPSALVVANSQAVMRELPERPGVQRVLLTPMVRAPRPHPEIARRFVTLINPAPEKGAHIFLQLARRMPHMPFLAQIGRSQPIPGLDLLPNVTIRQPAEELSHVYAATKVLLVPSPAEPFGRVALEGALAGCLLLLHRAAGLMEVPAPDFCFVEGLDAAVWERRLTEMWNVPEERRAALAARIVSRAREYDSGWDALMARLQTMAGASPNAVRTEPAKTIEEVFSRDLQPRLRSDAGRFGYAQPPCQLVVVAGTQTSSWVVDFTGREIRRGDGPAACTVRLSQGDLMDLVSRATTIEALRQKPGRLSAEGATDGVLPALIRLLQ